MPSFIKNNRGEAHPGDFEVLREALQSSSGETSALYNGVRLTSHFQPIFSFSHQRSIGYEGLMRGWGINDGLPIPPLELLDSCHNFEETLVLDRLSRLVHLSNFSRHKSQLEWLFLNMHPDAFLRAGRDDCVPVFQRMLDLSGLRPQQIVIEVLENAVRSAVDFGRSTDFFRELGCLIAVDDFGAGHSNFDRIWQIKPQIVKLDRSLIVRATTSAKVCRMLGQMVSLLHECGSLVLMEGIETADEAQIALDADVDFAQGYYFGRPQPQIDHAPTGTVELQALWQAFDLYSKADRKNQQERIAPYSNALGYASVMISAGHGMVEACTPFLELEGADQCYLLDNHARQIGQNLCSSQHDHSIDRRFAPLADAHGARWARRPYFKRAIEHFGSVQITRPYLSISSAKLCVTLSASLRKGDEIYVICGDVRLKDE